MTAGSAAFEAGREYVRRLRATGWRLPDRVADDVALILRPWYQQASARQSATPKPGGTTPVQKPQGPTHPPNKPNVGQVVAS